MRIAYLIDRPSLGGGNEYIRRRIACRPDDVCEVFYASTGACTAGKMDAWKADVICVNHLRALVQLLGNPFRRPRGEVVFVVHGLHLRKFDFLPRTPGNRLRRFLRLMLERWLYRRCTRLVALTPTDAADIRRLYGSALDVTVEPNTNEGVSLRPAEGLRYGADAFAFVSIARFDFPKGQDILLQAVDRAQHVLRTAGARTLLIGDGETWRDMKRFAEERGISDLVEFAGAIPDAGVYMTCGRVLLAPSRWEGMPYLLLEAVARGRRVLATDCPGNRDVLKDYAQARLVPVASVDALARGLESAILWS